MPVLIASIGDVTAPAPWLPDIPADRAQAAVAHLIRSGHLRIVATPDGPGVEPTDAGLARMRGARA